MIHRRNLTLALAASALIPTMALAQSQPATDTAPAIIEMALGNADAKVTVMEYASFTCPHCADFHENQFQDLKKEYIDTGKIHFVYRDVYFDRVGLWAAMLARCEPDRFFGVSAMLYSKQKEWLSSNDPVQIADNLRKLGKVAGLEEDRINACMEDGETAKALVEWFQVNVKADEISSTPTLIINGENHSNMSFDKLKEILDAKLAE